MYILELFSHANHTSTSKIREAKKITAKNDPCWSGYHMVGTKSKDGREVPNCVPGQKGAMNEDYSISDIIQAKELIGQALRNPNAKHEYFNFLKFLRSKHGADYSTRIHQQASDLARTSK